MCAKLCYARQGTYRFPSVIAAHERNLLMVRDQLPAWEALMTREVAHPRYRQRWIRIHDSGDFYDDSYVEAWLRIAASAPWTGFYCYTKAVSRFKRLVVGRAPENFLWCFSLGGTEDHLIDRETDRHADVFPDEETLTAAGYSSQAGSDLLAVLGPRRVGIPRTTSLTCVNGRRGRASARSRRPRTKHEPEGRRAMAPPMTAAKFMEILVAEGLRVQTTPGWATYNRNAVGAWGPLNGVMIHHTGSGESGVLDYVIRGNPPALPGPLCHGLIHKDGLVTLIGWGRTNHAGKGDSDVLAAVVAEKTAYPKPGTGDVDGNPHFVGFECINLGTGKDSWPQVQLDSMARASAAVCRYYGWTRQSVIGHKEWTSLKPDPSGLAMGEFRTAVGGVLALPAGVWSRC